MNTKADVPEGRQLLVRIPFGKLEIVCTAEVVYKNPGLGLGVRPSLIYQMIRVRC
jgi:hypothetical protein